ncbi:MAG: tetratricopeptide repeat protein [Treponema sp.]
MKKYIIFSFILLSLSSSIFAKEDLSSEYFYIAEAYSELKKYEKAIEFYKKVVNIPEYANAATYNIARMHAFLEQWNEAVSMLKILYEKEKTNEKILTSYAYALSASGKIEQAQDIYKELYENNKESPSIAFNYVRLLIVAKKYDDASNLLKELTEKFIEDEETRTISDLKASIEKLTNPLKEIKEKEALEEENEEVEEKENTDTKDNTDKKENNDNKGSKENKESTPINKEKQK